MTNIQQLIKLDYDTRCAKTSMRPDYVPKTKFTDKTANGLEKCVVAWCKLNGWMCERVKNTGRYIDTSTTVTNVVGHTRVFKSGKFIKGTGTNGTADCRAVIMGRSVSIEVKIGRDVQSEAQKKYQADVERAGGYYFIVKSFDDFIEKYNQLLDKLK